MKLMLDTHGRNYQVCKAPEPKTDQNGTQRIDKRTSQKMWVTQVFVLDNDGGEVILVTTLGNEAPVVALGDQVEPVELEAVPWVQKDRNGVMYRCAELRRAKAVAAGK